MTARPLPLLLLLIAALALCPSVSHGAQGMMRGGMGAMHGGQGMSGGHVMMGPSELVLRLAALGDRSTGTEGADRATELVEEELRNAVPAHLSPVFGRQRLRVPVQHFESGSISAGGRTMRLRPLRRNALSPGAVAPPGIDAPALYAGRGELNEFNGHDPRGAVVFMDMRSGKNWMHAAMLGARALVFLGGDETGAEASRNVFEDKNELTPIDFPRFWMPRDEAAALFGPEARPAPGERVRIDAEAAWENAPAANVWCFIPGADPALSQDVLVVEAFYDSTANVPGLSPGADEAASIDALLVMAKQFGSAPPARSVLLVATAAHAQDHAGMREFIWAMTSDADVLTEEAARLAAREADARRSIALLEQFDPFAAPREYAPDDKRLLREALGEIVKERVDALSNRLMRLRLAQQTDADKERIRVLAEERMGYRRLTWFESLDGLTDGDRRTLAGVIPDALAHQRAIVADAGEQLAGIRDGIALRETVGERSVAASVSLHLSGGGRGVGAFERGWMYEFYEHVNRSRFYVELDEALARAAQALPPGMRGSFADTLRPSALDSWQSYLPDQPHMAGEVAALAGLRGFTLATTYDARPLWGTPYDTADRLDPRGLMRQERIVAHLLRALADGPLDAPGTNPTDSFTTLTARANLMRQGEVFPDRPAEGSVFLAFQGPARFYAMIDTEGRFRLPGIANYRHSMHKAVLEGFRFDRETGRAVWAVDKPLTGKNSYRVKMKRKRVDTDLTMFACAQTTMFGMYEPRSFRYLTVPQLIDARTESRPLRYWYSRFDTRESTLGTYFLQPDVPLKITLSDTVLDKKVILLNATPDDPTGAGYLVGANPLIPYTEYQAARDMWLLTAPRIDALEERGIVNERIRAIRTQGEAALERAETARGDLRWDEFMTEARASLALAGQVYNDVDATQRDVLVGVLFYVALFIPFAYCMERLLFGFADIHKRIGAFLGLLVGIIGAVSLVHPAFELTYSPSVVILAFFIVGLSVLVSLIIFFRFEREMVELQRRARHMKMTGISRFAAFAAAFGLGVSNLRRRPLRTALTCLTLTILTFTIMNFTAVKSQRQRGWTSFAADAPYHGLMLKSLGWKDLPIEALSVIRTTFGGEAHVAPRVWYVTGDATRPPAVPLRREDAVVTAQGIVGLSHTEPQVSSLPRTLMRGRWFTESERHALLLPDGLARELGVDPTDPAKSGVDLWGMHFTVTGTFRDDGLETTPDLDGEPVTPIFYPSEAATRLSEVEAEAIEEGEDVIDFQSRYQHVDGERTVIMPYRTLLALGGGGGRLKGVALAPRDGDARSLGEDLGERFGLMLFRGGEGGTSVYYASTGTRYSGVANIAIPLAISILIVLNTMIGSVYERRSEIAVYTSVGLAPSHVGFLFVAEALAFGVISVVAGYLLAQTAAGFLAGTWVWQGMTANYSSTAGVAAMVLVMLVVLVSALYPARVASEIAIPDVNRSWTMPKADGDRMALTLPFLINIQEQASAGGFLQHYYDAHQDVSHGLFCTDDMQCQFMSPETLGQQGTVDLDLNAGAMCLGMDLRVWLAPFDFGVRQHVALHFCPSVQYPGFMQIRLTMTREAGERTAWTRANRQFVNDLRKQLLVWRSLDDETTERYGRDLQIASAAPVHGTEAPA